MLSALGITWPLTTVSGYGIYGLEIARCFFRQGGGQLVLTKPPLALAIPPLLQLRLGPSFQLGQKIDQALRANAQELMRFDHPVLHGVGNNFAGFAGSDQVRGKPNVGCAAIEHLAHDATGRAVAGNYDLFIAISRWNAAWLQSLNIGRVRLCHQGIDDTLFRPGPRQNLFPDRFVIFSGGKFEFRKAQDIVTAAFKIFAARHPDALLICAWQGLGAPDPAPFLAAGHVANVPQKSADGQGLDIAPWLRAQGLEPRQFIALPFTHQIFMPQVLWECDVALFPNRCEGGTNLVAMEAAACGVPTYVSANTGQRDLIDDLGLLPLCDQKPVQPLASPLAAVTDWGESSVEECVAALENVYQNRAEARAAALTRVPAVHAWNWHAQNLKLLDVLERS